MRFRWLLWYCSTAKDEGTRHSKSAAPSHHFKMPLLMNSPPNPLLKYGRHAIVQVGRFNLVQSSLSYKSANCTSGHNCTVWGIGSGGGASELVDRSVTLGDSALSGSALIACGSSSPRPRSRRVFDLGVARCAGHRCAIHKPRRSLRHRCYKARIISVAE